MEGHVKCTRSRFHVDFAELLCLFTERIQLRLHEFRLYLDDILERFGFTEPLHKFKCRGDILLGIAL